jgi:hypothetical protein
MSTTECKQAEEHSMLSTEGFFNIANTNSFLKFLSVCIILFAPCTNWVPQGNLTIAQTSANLKTSGFPAGPCTKFNKQQRVLQTELRAM